MSESTLISKKTAAHYLGVSESTVDRLRQDGEIEAIRVRGLVRVFVPSLDAFTTRQREQAEAERKAMQALAPRRRTDPFTADAFPIPALDRRRAERKAA